MIPKIIHYVWVGDEEKPPLVCSCIESWKRFCPDYKIMEWNNRNLNEIENDYLHEAFVSKKWAFVSDYLRLYALYHHGGIYCDTDLQITASIDSFRNNHFFTGFEKYKGKVSPLTAFMGAEKGNEIIQGLLVEYDSLHFIKKNGELDFTTNVARIRRYLIRHFSLNDKILSKDQMLELAPGYLICPSFYFCTPQENQKNYAIHHFSGSWLPDYTRKLIIEVRSELFNFLNFRVSVFHKVKNNIKKIPIRDTEKQLLKINLSNNYALVVTTAKE